MFEGQKRGGFHRDARERVRELLPRILELRAEGLTFAEIGSRVGLKKATVQAACRRHDAPVSGNGKGRVHRRKGEIDGLAVRIHRMREEGKRDSEIARGLGLRGWKEVKEIVKTARRRGVVPAYEAPRRWEKEELEDAIVALAKAKGRYVGFDEVKHELRMSAPVAVKHRISIVELNRRAGFREPHNVFELAVEVVLASIYGCVLKQHKFEGCLSPKGYKLRFDFYVPEARLLVEADGVQHDPDWSEWEAWGDADYRQKCDEIKNEFAVDNSYVLVRVPYARLVTREWVQQAFEAAGVSLFEAPHETAEKAVVFSSRHRREKEESSVAGKIVRYETAEEWLVRGKGIVDGARSLEEAVKLAEGFAAELRTMIADGWKIAGAVEDDYVWCEHPARIEARKARRKAARGRSRNVEQEKTGPGDAVEATIPPPEDAPE